MYSQLKPLHHKTHIQSLKKGVVVPPVHVQMILSDLCNQDCGFCAYRMSGGLSTELFGTAETHNPNRKMPTQKALEIIDDCAEMGVQAIQFTGGGEPTVHKDHLEIIGYAQLKQMKTALVTNGVRLDTTHPSIRGLTWLRISVDAGTPATYAKVRNVLPVHWDRVWANIDKLRDFRGRLGVGFVVTNENFREVGEAARLCAEYGVPYLRVGAVFSEQGMSFYEDINAIHDAIDEAKIYDSKGMKIVDLFGRRLGDLEHGQPEDSFCGYQFFTTYIGADLNVYRCCNTAYTTPGKVASLKQGRFRDLYNTDRDFDARDCRYCQFLGQNRAINAMLETPEHVEFV